jgi:hypothetical protein
MDFSLVAWNSLLVNWAEVCISHALVLITNNKRLCFFNFQSSTPNHVFTPFGLSCVVWSGPIGLFRLLLMLALGVAL